MTVPNEKLISTAKEMYKYCPYDVQDVIHQLIEALEDARCEIWHLEGRIARLEEQKPSSTCNLGIFERAFIWRDPDGNIYRWDEHLQKWVIYTDNGRQPSLYQPPVGGPYTEVVEPSHDQP